MPASTINDSNYATLVLASLAAKFQNKSYLERSKEETSQIEREKIQAALKSIYSTNEDILFRL